MYVFLLAVVLLILGYCVYGVFVEKILCINPKRLTPAIRLRDGVDFVSMHPTKIFLIQFLNIAGIGPVFGAILGALYGPVCLLWIVLGSIFAGAVHDFLNGILSVRDQGCTMAQMVQQYFGRYIYPIFLLIMSLALLLAGSIFAQTPAHMLSDLTGISFITLLCLIFIYYFLATLLPIDKIIGRFYPIFGSCLIVSTLLLIGSLFLKGNTFYPDLSTLNQHPQSLPIFPIMFITIACGALSGFHATQTPLMARCITNEKYARPCFYGAMILEGFIALIWATLGIAYYQGTQGLNEALGAAGNAGGVVKSISIGCLGQVGGILAVLSVVSLTITSGDTALRSARLSFAECFHLTQTKIAKRLILTIFVSAVSFGLALVDLNKIWLYFGLTNQTLATIMLWIGAIYLRKTGRNYWIALIPAIFITSVTTTCLAYAEYAFDLDLEVSRWIGAVATVVFVCLFFIKIKGRHIKKMHKERI